jgi:hypothetical protein
MAKPPDGAPRKSIAYWKSFNAAPRIPDRGKSILYDTAKIAKSEVAPFWARPLDGNYVADNVAIIIRSP